MMGGALGGDPPDNGRERLSPREDILPVVTAAPQRRRRPGPEKKKKIPYLLCSIY
jgi:hypothetical protein